VVAADQFSALPSIIIDLLMLAAFGAAKTAARAGTLPNRAMASRRDAGETESGVSGPEPSAASAATVDAADPVAVAGREMPSKRDVMPSERDAVPSEVSPPAP